MSIKAVLIDFDGTLVKEDILDIVCGIVGKEKESRELNSKYHQGRYEGRESLITRINFLKGVSYSQIKSKLDKNNYLRKGAKQLIDFLARNNIVSILYSGNIVPILQYYQEVLNIDYIVGTGPRMKGDVITGISEKDFPKGNFKITGIERILNKLNISPEQTLAIGDSRADIPIFQFAGYSIAINAPNEVEKEAGRSISNLNEAIPIIRKLLYE